MNPKRGYPFKEDMADGITLRDESLAACGRSMCPTSPMKSVRLFGIIGFAIFLGVCLNTLLMMIWHFAITQVRSWDYYLISASIQLYWYYVLVFCFVMPSVNVFPALKKKTIIAGTAIGATVGIGAHVSLLNPDNALSLAIVGAISGYLGGLFVATFNH